MLFNSTLTYKTYNPAVTAGTEGLEYNQLKPALKCDHIIEAIENKYDISFSEGFLWGFRVPRLIYVDQ